jgi:hypothetical protein
MIAAFARTALALCLLLALLLSAGCSFYLGEPRVPETRFRASLYGANEVPPVDGRGSGYFEAVYRPSTHVLEYKLNLVGLSSPMVMGYLHGPARPDENVPKVSPINIPIYYYGSGVWDGVTLTPEQAAQVVAGQWYVNVMTTDHPDGEIRGQIMPLK